ncbi:quinone-dependent dihydroorotate dehydrogenase [Denitromonas iodatirespirans]|uniref:Dihydroorotate dehydrogenase (quinone) n=1 Tax=Denitromonas iodatirespirans TaxID=2795389 RepID=A0A944D992_DENI1|nr:quinone-dependent dihydroorotate dehydrogenase [Denitromonas iodatirespirans]MBT0960726.1 quinone-dependent dihydroorotate dehydrogenase [Denitromonas iodatirespirans]
MLYDLIRSVFFAMDAERAHGLGMTALRLGGQLLPPATPLPAMPTEVMGITFPNRVGLAAGLDKNGEAIDGLARIGFGFLEIGTVTPRPQPGNPKPRLFRLPEVEGIINRMGFNNHGVDALVANVKAAKYRGVLGINIGKNFDTPIERAVDDYLACLDKVYALASYVTVNISSPNTKNLRALQGASELDALLGPLKAAQERLADRHGKQVPLALKIAPDLDDDQIAQIADAVRRHRFEAIIATNTTIAREAVQGLRHGDETGGLSGGPVREASTRVIRALAGRLGGEVPIIGVGGILDGAGAREKIEAGARLVQIYSGLIYHGPRLIRDCVAATDRHY